MPIFVRFLGKVVVMAKKRVLFISQEIVPYLPESEDFYLKGYKTKVKRLEHSCPVTAASMKDGINFTR